MIDERSSWASEVVAPASEVVQPGDMRKSSGPCLATLLSLGLLCGCSSDSGQAGPPGSGGSGGAGGGTGGQGGGTPAGGSGGGGGGKAGTGGAGSGSGGAGGDPTAALDACFAGLRKLAEANNQISTKRSADGKYAVRIALEDPPGFVGTSGTVPWAAVRFAIVTPQRQLCVQDEKVLKEAYGGSLHNCSDVLTVTSEGSTYQLKYPDTTPERPATILSISGAATLPPTTLTMVSCQRQAGGQCLSGGPCQ
jgi:hypothetical protein